MGNTGSHFGSFLCGVGIGAGIALLFAPKSGGETRMYLKDRMSDGKQFAQDKSGEMQRQAKELLGRGEQLITQQVERLTSAVDAGRAAYRQAKPNGSATNT